MLVEYTHPGINETGSADEFQRNAAPLEVDLDDADADVLVDFEDI